MNNEKHSCLATACKVSHPQVAFLWLQCFDFLIMVLPAMPIFTLLWYTVEFSVYCIYTLMSFFSLMISKMKLDISLSVFVRYLTQYINNTVLFCPHCITYASQEVLLFNRGLCCILIVCSCRLCRMESFVSSRPTRCWRSWQPVGRCVCRRHSKTK